MQFWTVGSARHSMCLSLHLIPYSVLPRATDQEIPLGGVHLHTNTIARQIGTNHTHPHPHTHTHTHTLCLHLPLLPAHSPVTTTAALSITHTQTSWHTHTYTRMHYSLTDQLMHTLTRARCGHANTQQPPCGWHDEALGVDVMTPRQARNHVMKNSVMWLFHETKRFSGIASSSKEQQCFPRLSYSWP